MLRWFSHSLTRGARPRPKRARLWVEELGDRILPSGSPVAAPDSYSVLTQGQIRVSAPGVLANDYDPNGLALSVATFGAPAHGRLTWMGNGGFCYTPNPGFVGSDQFFYTATDGAGTSNPAPVTLNVTLAGAATTPNVPTEGTTFTTPLAMFTVAPGGANPVAGNFSATIDWGDGNTGMGAIMATGGRTFRVIGANTYVDDGRYPVLVTISDNQGNSIVVTNEVTVLNAPPVANAGSNQTVNEESQVNLQGAFTDRGVLDTHTFLWHITSDNGQTIADGTGQNYSFVPNHAGTYTATFTVTDNAGASNSSSVTITALHVSPTLGLSGLPEVDEGFTYTLNLSSYESGTEVIQGWTINWGDGSAAQQVSGNPTAVTHVFNEPGECVISATATDDVGTYAAGNTQSVAVVNTPPTVDVAVTYGQGRSVTLSGHVTDPVPAGLTVTFSGVVRGTATTDANGYYSLTATASGLGQVSASTVDIGGLASNTATTTVTSAAPVITGFNVARGDTDTVIITGQVQDESPGGLVVILNGIPSLNNVPVTVNADGSFEYIFAATNADAGGTVTATVTDWWGLVGRAQDCLT